MRSVAGEGPSGVNGVVPWRSILLLSLAAFASASAIRAVDPLLPVIGRDFGVSTGSAASVVVAFSISYGVLQLVSGLLGDRVGKYRMVTVATLASAFGTALCAFTFSIETLTLARLLSGALAAAIMPMGLAWIGDAIAYEDRQVVLSRYIPGQILGVIFGQIVGGVVGELLGWRAVFLTIALLQLVIGIALLFEYRSSRRPAAAETRRDDSFLALALGMAGLLRQRWVGIILAAVFIETFAVFGVLAFVASYLQMELDVGLGAAGAMMGAFGLGGLIYAALSKRLVTWLGQDGLARSGGMLLGIAFALFWPLASVAAAPLLIAAAGLGFYMLHNTLQVNATQMAPEARSASVALYASALLFGQTVGVAVAAVVFDRYGAEPLFAAVAIIVPLLSLWFARQLRRSGRMQAPQPELSEAG